MVNNALYLHYVMAKRYVLMNSTITLFLLTQHFINLLETFTTGNHDQQKYPF